MNKFFSLFSVSIILFFSCNSKMLQVDNEKIKTENNIDYIPYYLKVYEADSLYLTNNFQRSYEILDSLFKVYEPLNIDNYAEYSVYLNCCLKSGHFENLREKVIYGLTHFGGIQTLHKDSRKMYLELKDKTSISNDEENELKIKYYNSLDLELRKKMLQMFNDDQAVRLENGSNEEMKIVDEKNRIELNSIFKNYGSPTKRLIGSNNAYDTPDKGHIDFEVFFLHQSDSVRKKYLPILLDGAKKGFCEPDVYATLYDRMQLESIGKQYFGSYSCSSDNEVCTLSNPKKIDSIRKSIGLPPSIKYYSWKVKQYSD